MKVVINKEILDRINSLEGDKNYTIKMYKEDNVEELQIEAHKVSFSETIFLRNVREGFHVSIYPHLKKVLINTYKDNTGYSEIYDKIEVLPNGIVI